MNDIASTAGNPGEDSDHTDPPLQGDLVLQLVGSQRNGQILRVSARKCLVGAASHCTICIKAQRVQPVHCLIVRGERDTLIRCLATDTQLNGRPFETSSLQAGDRISIGPVDLDVVDLRHVAPASRPAADRGTETLDVTSVAEPLVATAFVQEAPLGQLTVQEQPAPPLSPDEWAQIAAQEARGQTRRQLRRRSRRFLQRLKAAGRQLELQQVDIEDQQAALADRIGEFAAQRELLESQQQELHQQRELLHEVQHGLSDRLARLESVDSNEGAVEGELAGVHSRLDDLAAVTERWGEVERRQSGMETRWTESQEEVRKLAASCDQLSSRLDQIHRQQGELAGRFSELASAQSGIGAEHARLIDEQTAVASRLEELFALHEQILEDSERASGGGDPSEPVLQLANDLEGRLDAVEQRLADLQAERAWEDRQPPSGQAPAESGPHRSAGAVAPGNGDEGGEAASSEQSAARAASLVDQAIDTLDEVAAEDSACIEVEDDGDDEAAACGSAQVEAARDEAGVEDRENACVEDQAVDDVSGDDVLPPTPAVGQAGPVALDWPLEMASGAMTDIGGATIGMDAVVNPSATMPLQGMATPATSFGPEPLGNRPMENDVPVEPVGDGEIDRLRNNIASMLSEESAVSDAGQVIVEIDDPAPSEIPDPAAAESADGGDADARQEVELSRPELKASPDEQTQLADAEPMEQSAAEPDEESNFAEKQEAAEFIDAADDPDDDAGSGELDVVADDEPGLREDEVTDEEESIEEYMAKLLKRVRGQSSATEDDAPAAPQPKRKPESRTRSSSAAGDKNRKTESSAKPSAAVSSTDGVADPARKAKAGTEAEVLAKAFANEIKAREQEFGDVDGAAKPVAPVEREKLKAMRELANDSARSAIFVSKQKRAASVAYAQLAVSAGSLIGSLVLFRSASSIFSLEFGGAMGALGFSATLGYQVYRWYRSSGETYEGNESPAEGLDGWDDDATAAVLDGPQAPESPTPLDSTPMVQVPGPPRQEGDADSAAVNSGDRVTKAVDAKPASGSAVE